MNQYILDANVLFSGIISQKPIYRLMFGRNIFYTPDFVKAEELNTYRTVFLKKSAVTQIDLKEFAIFIFSKIIVVPDYIITPESYERAEKLVAEIDPKDVMYVALSIELDVTLLTLNKPLYEGLLKNGYTRIQLFGDFIAGQLIGKESE